MVGKTNVAGARLRAVIAVTYPEGSVCTCSNGTKTLKARDTSGKALFSVSIGTWTVTATDGNKTKDATVDITTEGQCESVELMYRSYLYNRGDECEHITGGWTYKKLFGSCSVTKNSDNIYVVCTEGSSGAAVSVYPTNKIDLTSKSKLKLNFSSTRLNITDTELRVITEPYNGTVIAKTVLGKTGTDITVELDVSNVSGEYYVEIYATSYHGDTNLTIHEVSLR